MFEWIFEGRFKARKEKTERLYALLHSFELTQFKEQLLHILQTEWSDAVLWDFTDFNKRTFLHLGVMIGDLEILNLLKRVPINAQDNRGYTALHYASMIYNNREIFQELLRGGIDITTQSHQGYTAYDIVEGFWQDECKRVSLREQVDKKFFKKVFMKKVTTLFDKSFPTSAAAGFLKENPGIEKILRDNQILLDLINKKRFMEHMDCPQNKTVDFATFLEPYFVHFGQPTWDDLYWYEVPKERPNSKHFELHENSKPRLSKILLPAEDDIFARECKLGLSKLYEEPKAMSVKDARSETVSSVVMNSRMGRWHPHRPESIGVNDSMAPTQTSVATSHLQRGFNTGEVGLTSENLTSLGSPSASEIQASAIHRFFQNKADSDGFSEYSFASTSANTDGWELGYQRRAY